MKVMLTENQSDVDLTDSFIGQTYKNERTRSNSELKFLYLELDVLIFVLKGCFKDTFWDQIETLGIFTLN